MEKRYIADRNATGKVTLKGPGLDYHYVSKLSEADLARLLDALERAFRAGQTNRSCEISALLRDER